MVLKNQQKKPKQNKQTKSHTIPRYLCRKTLVPVNPQAWLIISLNIKNAFRNFLADASHIRKAYEAYKWLRNKHKERVKTYNQLLKNKKAVDEDKSRLRQESDAQKESVLKMEEALTYVKGYMAELQAK